MLPLDPQRATTPVRRPGAASDPGGPIEVAADFGMPPLPPALSSDQMGEALLQALRRRWLPVLSLGLVAAAIAVGVTWYLMPVRYTATALVHLDSVPPQGLLVSGEHQDDFLAYQRTQATMVKGRLVLQAALRRPEVAELREIRAQGDPVQWLGENIVVDSTLGPEIMRVSLAGANPQDLPVALNAVVQAYLNEVGGKERARRQTQMEQVWEKYRSAEEELRRKRGLLRELEASLGTEDPQTVALHYQSSLQQLGEAQKQKLQAHLALQNARLELAAARKAAAKPPEVVITPLAVDEYLRLDPESQRVYARLARVEDEIGNAQAVAAPSVRDSVIAGAQAERDAAEQELASLRRRVGPKVEQMLREKAAGELRITIAKLENQINLYDVQEKGLELEVRRLDAESKRLARSVRQPDKPTTDVEALRDEVAQAEQSLRKVSDQLGLLKVEPSLPQRATLLEPADVPQTPTLDRTVKFSGLAGLAALGLVLVGGSWREYRVRRVYTEDDVVRGLGMRLVGTLPALPEAIRQLSPEAAPRDQYWHVRLAESVDAIRTRLLHAAQREGLRAVMITSAAGGEGKTSLASHLAASLSRAGRKTLLIDADLRNPGLHRPFDLPAEPGFAEILRGEAEPEEAIRPTAMNRLWLLPAGRCDGEAIQALAQDRVRSILDALKERYDFIVVDSSPVLPVADALSLGQHTDGVLFSVLRDVSRIPSVYAAHQRLAALGIRILGTVVIGGGSDHASRGYDYPKPRQER